MTDREQAAFAAGLAHAASLAQIAAISLEVRDDARHLRQQAAIAALRGLAEGLKEQAANGAAEPEITVDNIHGDLKRSSTAETVTSAGLETVDNVHGFETASAPDFVDNIHEVPVEQPSEGRTIRTTLSDQRHAAIAQGYTGDPCPSCQSFTMKRSGTCQVCDTCGQTTGCS